MRERPSLSPLVALALTFFGHFGPVTPALGAGGSLTIRLEDENSSEPAISRVEFFRGAAPTAKREKHMPVRNTVPAGLGLVVDRAVVLELPDGPYRFTATRGPEYRIVRGTFELEKTSLDEKTIVLPRMADMAGEGWISGDCCVVPSSYSLPLRMASEDLHVAAVLGVQKAKPIPRRDRDEKIEHDPSWIRADATHTNGLVFYGSLPKPKGDGPEAFAMLAAIDQDTPQPTRIGVENPFAWELPVWLASKRVDGLFVLGDWLRLDKRVLRIREGRNLDSFSLNEPTQLGRYAERIYRNALDAGLSIVPLAGGGDRSAQTPVGYNRMYVTRPGGTSGDVDSPVAPTSDGDWWDQLWAGHSVATNGPLLRPMVGGRLPGSTFQARSGESLLLQPELNLTVRDPVEYLEVIHNNRVHYSARLDEFARAGGVIPAIEAKESGWVVIRVLTLHGEHYRAAMSAPWWIEFDGRKRVSKSAVDFFSDWLADYEAKLRQLPADELQVYVPYIQAARRFWSELEAVAQ
ncbi:MAG: hypothetical protein AAFX06_19275 [Planctomycetota bacterium]